MSTIEVMRKALEALEHAEKDAADFQRINTDQTGAAITALRAEIERLDAVEPVAWSISHDGKTPYMLWESGDGALLDLEVKRVGGTACKLALYTAPVAPTIPALTIDEVAEGAPGFSNVPKYGPAYLAGAHWAYTLAAARTGARIIKADTLQELADDAKQIGLEY